MVVPSAIVGSRGLLHRCLRSFRQKMESRYLGALVSAHGQLSAGRGWACEMQREGLCRAGRQGVGFEENSAVCFSRLTPAFLPQSKVKPHWTLPSIFNGKELYNIAWDRHGCSWLYFIAFPTPPPIFYLFFNLQRVKSLSQTLGIHSQQIIYLEQQSALQASCWALMI